MQRTEAELRTYIFVDKYLWPDWWAVVAPFCVVGLFHNKFSAVCQTLQYQQCHLYRLLQNLSPSYIYFPLLSIAVRFHNGQLFQNINRVGRLVCWSPMLNFAGRCAQFLQILTHFQSKLVQFLQILTPFSVKVGAIFANTNNRIFSQRWHLIIDLVVVPAAHCGFNFITLALSSKKL